MLQSWTVVQLREFLNLKGITVARGVSKVQLVNLCIAAQPLQDDPDMQQCDTDKIIKRKLISIGIFCDPLSLKFSSKFSPDDSPPFGLIDIFNYLIFSRADYDRKKLKAYKSFNDYKLFEDGHVQSLSLHKAKHHFVYRADVLPTCKKSTFLQTSTYSCWFVLNEEGDVYTAFCECMGG